MTSRKAATKKCLYCNNRDHTILKCKKDSIMFSSLSARDMKNKEALSRFSKKQLLRLIVELCRHNITAPFGTKSFIEHVSPHCNKQKVVEFVHSLVQDISGTEKKECPICYEELGKTKCKTRCGHDFCTGCFTQLCTSTHSRMPICPMCREPLLEPVNNNRRTANDESQRAVSRNLHGYRTGSHLTGHSHNRW